MAVSSEYINNPDEVRDFLPKYQYFYLLLFFTSVIFLSRLLYLQVYKGEDLRDFSEKNRLKPVKLLAPRGFIFDRNNQVLVENHPGLDAQISLQYATKLDEVVAKVAPILNMESEKLLQRIQRHKKINGPFAIFKLKENLNKDETFRLKKIRINTPGLEIRESVIRHYPLGENGAQLFGYAREVTKNQIERINRTYAGKFSVKQGDIVGQSGLEEKLEKDVRGQDGIQFLQVDAFGRESSNQANIYGEGLVDQDPVPGFDVQLTIDKDVQIAAHKAFVDNKRIGSLVAMKSNGEILAWVNSPSFDPNDFVKGTLNWSELVNDPFKPLRNKIVQDPLSPGSTFKPLMAVAALQENIITPTKIISCPGVLVFGGRPFHDHLKQGHGNINVYDAIERSSNVFFYKMGIELGVDKIYNYISLLGLGAKTGIDVPLEASGLLPNTQWRKTARGEAWQPGDNLSVAIGQGFVSATPLQMALSYNSIATEGKVYRPFVIKQVTKENGKVETFQEQLIRNLQETQPNGVKISEETFKVVKEGMRRVIQGERGTARATRLPGVEMAGKTGTAQVMGFSASQIYSSCEARPIHQRHHGWLVAWAPADKPEITIAAVAEHSCHGSSGAGPLIKATMKAYFDKFHPGLLKSDDKPKATEEPKIEGE